MQIAFFAVCDKSLGLEDKQRVTSMYSLLFYNVLAYCISYIKVLTATNYYYLHFQLVIFISLNWFSFPYEHSNVALPYLC